ncbi:UNVERIFIED_CONTAM: DUF2921 domain-containing protein, partial [Salmonella enterica subsp. enterica serovar Weltevreden]
GSKSSNASNYYVSFSVSTIPYGSATSGVYKIRGSLMFHSPFGNSPRRVRFLLNGLWSEPDGKLCMVGRAPWQSEKGKPLELEGVFKLNYAAK